MRSFFKTCGVYALGAACLAGTAYAQDYRSPSLLPSTSAASYAPRIARAASVMAPTNPEGPAIDAPQPRVPNAPMAETLSPPSSEMLPPQSIHGGYGYYGDQAPGAGYGAPAPGYEFAPSQAPEHHGSVIYGEGGVVEGAYGCDSETYDAGFGGGLFGGSLFGRSACAANRPNCWFGGVRGLSMTLADEDAHWFSYDDINLERQILNTKDAEMDWSGGVEARIGRWFNCGQNGVELIYWGIYPEEQEANRTSDGVQGTLNHVFTFNSLTYDDGLGNGPAAVDNYFNNAERHRLQRDWSIHNVELNLLTVRNLYGGGCGSGAGCGPALGGLGMGCGCGPRLNVTWVAGFRFFRFDESFLFSSDPTDQVFDGSPDELHYGVDVDNELYGFQLGADTEFFLTRRVSLRTTTKFGVYNNHMEQEQRVGGAQGSAWVNDPISPNNGLAYNVSSDDDDIAFLGELDAGANFYLTNNLRLTGGYRVVGATGIARAKDQIPYNFDDIVGARDINSDGTMILHGAYGGVEFNY